jgi:hypothetical protein
MAGENATITGDTEAVEALAQRSAPSKWPAISFFSSPITFE